jgi:DUF4097 and DUF4098 domain-containing protein YvlB
MDEHISRILKMLEEGKISATDAESLISAIRTKEQAGAAPPPPPPPGAPSPPGGPRSESKAGSTAEGGTAKSFEFSWGHKRGFPFDLSGLGKQISDAVKKIDPEKIIREARTGVARGGKRWQDRVRSWASFMEGEDGRPENKLGLPTARETEDLIFQVSPDASVQVYNTYGAIMVLGGGEAVAVEVEKEVWAQTEEEAKARIKELKAEAMTHQVPGTGATRLEVRVTAPEEFRDGYANLRVRVPEGASLRLETVYGEIRVENTAGRVEVHTISGPVTLESLSGEVQAEGISGDMRASKIGGRLRLACKSGDLQAEDLSAGGEVVSVSGEVIVRRAGGGKLEAKSVSGDVFVEEAGMAQPIDLTVESVSGDISLTRARGQIVFKTVSGDANAQQVEAVTLQSQTVSGDVSLGLLAPFTGTLSANTVSGDMTVRLPETSSFRFTLSTQSGELHCGLTAQDANQTGTLYTGRVGDGTGTINVQTRSGDVTLERSE